MKKKNVTEAEVIEVKEGKTKQSNNFNYNELLPTIIMALVGLILLFLPEESNKFIGYGVASIVTILGIISVIRYFRNKAVLESLTLIGGIFYLLMGILIFIYPLSIMNFATLMMGVYLVVNGALKMHRGWLTRNLKLNRWKSLLISGTIILIFGIVLIVNPFSGLVITKIAGAFMLLVAIYEIVNKVLYKD